jgi:hypothetical protein
VRQVRGAYWKQNVNMYVLIALDVAPGGLMHELEVGIQGQSGWIENRGIP